MTENNSMPQHYLQEQDEVIDVKSWIFRLARVWPWFVASLLIFSTAAWFYLRYTEPVYQASASIIIKDEKKGGASAFDNPLLKELNLGGQGKLVENEIEVLRSIDMLETVVLQEQLFLTVKNKGHIANWTSFGADLPFRVEMSNPDTIDRNYTWYLNIAEKNWKMKFSKEGKEYPLKLGEWYNYRHMRFRIWPNIDFRAKTAAKLESKPDYILYFQPVAAAAVSLKESLEVKPVGKLASVISITLKDFHSVRATTALRALINIYNQQGLTDKNLVTNNTIDFLNERLTVLERELQGVENNVEGYKRENNVTDVSSQAALYLDLAKDIDKQKAEQETNLNLVDALEREMILNQDNPRLVPSTLGIAEPSLAILIQRHNELVLQRGRLSERAGAKNPALLDLQAQIKDIRLSLLENVKNLKTASNIAMNDIKRQDSRLRGRISNIPAMEKNLVQISRDQSVKQQIYLYLLQKREESAVSLASSVSDSRTIEKARSVGLVKPQPALVWSISLAFALLLPFIIIMVMDFFDNKIGSRHDIELNLRAPLLGEISFVKKIKTPIQIKANTRTVVAEQLRTIRTAISFTGKNEAIKTILISSHRPAEGKSFTSINLAASYALLNKKVLILEFDLRKPRLLRNLGMKSDNGISTLLTRGGNIKEMLVEIPGYNSNCWILPTGPIPPNPSELILGPRMPELMEDLKKEFDYIIMDTPPFSVVTDATLLQQFADISIIVLRQGFSYKEAITEINLRITRYPSMPIYTVLNGVGRYVKYSYYAAKYTYSGYGYGYGDGYMEDSEKKNEHQG